MWAPEQERVALAIEGGAEPTTMMVLDSGWHELIVGEAHAGTRYSFALEDGSRVPDPASRHQPDDVHGASEVINPAEYAWNDGAWRGRPWHEAIIYELHVGTFTPEGTFRAVIDKLDHLIELGITAIELMPIADFPGGRNWGYDGIYLFAPDSSYGRPDDLKALVDAAHAKGLMILLDVVYNHFGPDGNYLNNYACQFFTERHKTPWGAAINYDGPESHPVRKFMIHNALYWLEEYHFDGLRLDAVHAIIDDSDTHLLDELAERVRCQFVGERHIHLILENEENEAQRLERWPTGKPRFYTAQWNDDIHHLLHTAATGEQAGYYADYHRDTEKLARALAEGFAFQGEMMNYRGKPRGEPSCYLPPTAFVSFIQNHDQIGNRAFGDRLTSCAPPEAVRAIAAIYLLAPQIPMLFMGEEWAAAQPFLFFCDFEEELGDAVRKGRREEFARFPEFQDETARERIPDPVDETAFRSSKLAWEDLRREPHAEWLDWYRRVLVKRRTEIMPRLAHAPGNSGEYQTFSNGAFRVCWRLGDGSRLCLLANLSDTHLNDVAPSVGRMVWREGHADREKRTMAPWSLVWSIDHPERRETSPP
jgi:malto-oligosyltrehalose trehalohydrolase